MTSATANAANGNAACYFVERHRDTPVSAKTAFLESDGAGRSLTYQQLDEQSARVADFYRRHGIRREDRVVLLLLDEIEFPVLFWGSLKAGVIPVALNTLLGTGIYRRILEDCRARVLFVSPPLLETVQPLLIDHPTIEHVFVSGNEAVGDHPAILPQLADCSASDALDVNADECAFWLYSSGSTGQPKGVRHVHASLQFTAETYGRRTLGIETADIVYSAAKFFFAYGLGNAMTFPMSVGATTVLRAGRPTPDAVLSILNQYRPTIFYGVPTLYAATLAQLESGQGRCRAPLRRCISAGEALPAAIGSRWEQQVGCEILDGVGSTEMLHIFLSNQPGRVCYGTSGEAVPGYDIRLVDEHGAEVGVGEIGELLVNGESAASDYWNKRQKSRETFEGVWTRTGDKYERNSDGRLIYCGRTDDMFKVGGIWVSPFEVEQALVSHPAVLEAAVVPRRDEQDLEKPQAFIVLKAAPATEAVADELTDQLKSHVQAKIGKWKYPRWINFVDDLPKTATGKIQRFVLRD